MMESERKLLLINKLSAVQRQKKTRRKQSVTYRSTTSRPKMCPSILCHLYIPPLAYTTVSETAFSLEVPPLESTFIKHPLGIKEGLSLWNMISKKRDQTGSQCLIIITLEMQAVLDVQVYILLFLESADS